MPNILFIGDLNEGTRSLMRARKLARMASRMTCISNTPVPFLQGVDQPSLYTRILHKLKVPRDESGVNKSLIQSAQVEPAFDIAWVEKSAMLRPETLRIFRQLSPRTILAAVSEDDMYASHNRSLYYDRSLQHYDIVFTTKTYNLEELIRLGARRTCLFLDSFDEDLHRPLQQYAELEQKCINVGFIGTYEKERADTILWLGSQGVKVVVFGNGWSALKGVNGNIKIMDKPIIGDDYVEAINQTRINLGFLRKINRDQVTSRTMEITGCGGFLLAERTSRHMELFEEGKEAEFFADNDELLKKINHYEKSPDMLQEISDRGRERCMMSGYDMTTQLSRMLARIQEGNGGGH